MASGYIAHVNKDGTQQSLADHLSQVGELCSKLSSKIGLKHTGNIIGLLHDFGKYSAQFQKYIQSATGIINPDEDDYVDFKGLKGKIDHSSAGAQWIWKKIKGYGAQGQGELCAQILFLCIASHHSGLIDCLDLDGNNVFCKRNEKHVDLTHIFECEQNVDSIILEKINKIANEDLVKEMLCQIKLILKDTSPPLTKNYVVQEFYLGFFTKFLFSCLIDSDRINSSDFEFVEQKFMRSTDVPNWDKAIQRLDQKLATYNSETHISKIRKSISDNCHSRATDPQGLYTLNVPTGGGKTLASLRFALNHAKHHKLERIIYIIPYTSIIDQNADEIRKILDNSDEGNSWVLEHHSNIEPELQTWRSKLASENWDSPIVFTTMVQFLETTFGSGTSGVRRLHQLANSVLIFDEIQTLPINCVHIFCNAINFLTKYTKTTSVLCTATQPLLNQLKYSDLGQLDIPKENELVGDVDEVKNLFSDLERVEVVNKSKIGGWDQEEIVDLVLQEFNQNKGCLVIVNTKDWAQKIYQLCHIDGVDNESIFHLSTNQYSAHRKEILSKIRYRLDLKMPVLCVSTQLIEAGVDVSFPSVVRFMAGLDSIAQAAGRCNRHAELKDADGNFIKGKVTIVNPKSEPIDSLKDIRIGKEKCERVLRDSDIDQSDLLSPKGIERYFQYYFYERAADMVYRLEKEKTNILSLLSVNESNNYANKNNVRRLQKPYPLLMQSFMTAAKAFKSIDAPTQSVIIEHDKGKELVASLCGINLNDKKQYAKLLRMAQKYSVNVFPNVWRKLLEEEAVVEIQGEGIYYLKEQYYSEAFGLSTEPVSLPSALVY